MNDKLLTPEQEKSLVMRLKVAFIVNELQTQLKDVNPREIEPVGFYRELLKFVAGIAVDIGRKDAGEELEAAMMHQATGSPKREKNAVKELKKFYPSFGIHQQKIN